MNCKRLDQLLFARSVRCFANWNMLNVLKRAVWTSSFLLYCENTEGGTRDQSNGKCKEEPHAMTDLWVLQRGWFIISIRFVQEHHRLGEMIENSLDSKRVREIESIIYSPLWLSTRMRRCLIHPVNTLRHKSLSKSREKGRQ